MFSRRNEEVTVNTKGKSEGASMRPLFCIFSGLLDRMPWGLPSAKAQL